MHLPPVPTVPPDRRLPSPFPRRQNDGQETVYSHTTKFLIDGVLQGFNATVFAYGCTGAGKTYTMLGTPDSPGIMALTLSDLFDKVAQFESDPGMGVSYKVVASFLEVYNENIRDLLIAPVQKGGNKAEGTSEFLELREDPIKGPTVPGITEVVSSSSLEIMGLLHLGNSNRRQEATEANQTSSRSHAVLQVNVEQRDKTPGRQTAMKVMGHAAESAAPVQDTFFLKTLTT